MRKVDNAHMKRFLKHVKKHAEILQDLTNNNKDRKNKEVIEKENTKQNFPSRL